MGAAQQRRRLGTAGLRASMGSEVPPDPTSCLPDTVHTGNLDALHTLP